MANFTIILDDSMNGIETISVNDRESSLKVITDQLNEKKNLFGGNAENDNTGNAQLNNTTNGSDYRWRLIPTSDIVSVPMESDHLSKDAFLAKVMLTDGFDNKLDVIADRNVDKMPESDWEDTLIVLSVYLNMSVCDILAEIAKRREDTDNDSDIEEMYETMFDEYDDYDCPIDYPDDYNC